jgi:hypothetical protein
VSDLSMLRGADLSGLLNDLGFDPDDIAGTIAMSRTILDDPACSEAVGEQADWLTSQLGVFLHQPDGAPIQAEQPPATRMVSGRRPCLIHLLAFIATTHNVRAFHANRGVPHDISQATLADLGRQVSIHRRVFGSIGLQTYGWMSLHWTGQLYQLGRLQFDLGRVDPTSQWARALPDNVAPGDWVLGVHIPEAGPLDDAAVGASLSDVRPFLETYFPEVSATMQRCFSWMLDPYLRYVLPNSNITRFQNLFTPDGLFEDNNEDILYFVFRRRGIDDLDQLPRETSLQRAVLDRIKAGGSWQNRQGWRAF